MKKNNHITVTPLVETDKEQAKLLEEFINHEFEEYKDILSAINGARFTIEQVYGIDTGQGIWDRIIMAVVERDIKRLKKEPKK